MPPLPPPQVITEEMHQRARAKAGIHIAIPCFFTSIYSEFALCHPVAYKATTSDPDLLSYDEAMNDTAHAKDWQAAAAKEIQSLVEQKTWIEVPMSDAKSKILPGTWVFRRKRTPDGTIKKFKARYCVRGDLQEGDFETFAPVVAWSTVRLFLVLSIVLEWTTCSIDFSSAFVQATLENPVWIHCPRGFTSSHGAGTCLQLRKSLYGLAVAPRLWHKHLVSALKKMNFVASKYDTCLMTRPGMMLVMYVDDCGIAAKDPDSIDTFITDLKSRGFELTKEGSFAEFLGIKFEPTSDGGIHMTQSGLIKKIITATNMTDCNPNWTPATQLGLGADEDGPPMKESWGYSSIVGMLLYLSTNTRPDIAFAVSQVARFSTFPKQSHATAVKTIVRYLSRTSDKGMYVLPSKKLRIENYVDADFAGLFKRENDNDPVSVKSRTGYLITLANCPLVWKSQLQTAISLSTLEAEYSALSSSLRVVLHLRALLIEVSKAVALDPIKLSTIHCRAFEDNNGALSLAVNQRITNRTKYFLVKWHHFWQYVSNGTLTIEKISTTEQRADYLTKGLSRDVFEKIRKLVQGW